MIVLEASKTSEARDLPLRGELQPPEGPPLPVTSPLLRDPLNGPVRPSPKVQPGLRWGAVSNVWSPPRPGGRGRGSRRVGKRPGVPGRGRGLQRAAMRVPLSPHLLRPPDSRQNQRQLRKRTDSGSHTDVSSNATSAIPWLCDLGQAISPL